MLDNIDWSNPEDYQIELPEPSPTSPTFEDWFHAGQYCPECKNQTDEHHTHSYCKNCGKLSDRNRYPFLDNCKCKGKQRLHSIPRSATTQSTQIILTEQTPGLYPRYRSHTQRDFIITCISQDNLSKNQHQQNFTITFGG